MFPFYMGYCKVDNVLQEGYHMFINDKFYTVLRVAYPEHFENKLGYMLSILISEQIRFNTLEIYNDSFKHPESADTNVLFEVLFKNFKTNVYNKWNNVWHDNQKIVTLTYGNYEPDKK